jgi:hypothetical protein
VEQVHLLGVDRLKLMPAERMVLGAFLSHNINNALQLIIGEIAVRNYDVRWPRIDEALGRIRWTIERVGGESADGR